VITHVAASYPSVTSSDTDNCVLKGQNIRLTCEVTYNGTNMMPLKMRWRRLIRSSSSYSLSSWSSRTLSTVNASSVHRSSYTFTASGQTTDYYDCGVTFSYPTGIVLSGVERQYANRPSIRPSYGYYMSSLFAPKPVASKRIDFMSVLLIWPYCILADIFKMPSS